MRRLVRAARRLAPALAALALVSCAVGGMPAPESAPPPLGDREWDSPIRENMKPEHRVFYDMLNGLGDWTLIEPYGYVFRPDVNFVAWRPYTNGYWVPNDSWGWVWVSMDPFGWATDHYGRWLYDSFQGWVWVPNTLWAPAWVSWVGDPNYVGWAPLMANAATPPRSAFTFAPINALGRSDLALHVVAPAQLGTQLSELKPIDRRVTHGTLVTEAGPPIDEVERKAGPLKRAQLQDLVPPGALARERITPTGTTGGGKPLKTLDPVEAAHEARLAAQRQAAEAAAAEAERAKVGGAAPEKVPVVRAFGGPARPASGPPRPGARPRPADADSTER